jgi:protein phosphatase
MHQMATSWDHGLQVVARTDVGLRRANNQDSMAIALARDTYRWHRRGHFFMVADGMGAHAAGELASKLATDIVPLVYQKLKDVSPPEALRQAILEANQEIHRRGQASDDFRGMGTTAAVLVLLPQGALIAHVGDSRVYRWRGHRLEQLTFDHSLLWEMRAAGHFAGGGELDFVPRNIITRSLGPSPEVQVDLEGPFPVSPGDIFLLCSDGLSGPVADEEIGKILGAMEPEEAVGALIDLANLRGGPDNITVVVARVDETSTAYGDQVEQAPAERPRRLRRPMHPALLASIVTFALVAAWLFSARQYVWAVASLVGFVGTLVAALVQRFGGHETQHEIPGQAYGRAPYQVSDCQPDRGFCLCLATVIEEVRDAAIQEHWKVDWDRFNAHSDKAASLTDRGDYGEAIREYCRAMTFIMSELKSQRRMKKNNGAGAPDLA